MRRIGPSTAASSADWSKVADGLADGGAQFTLADVEAGLGLLAAVGAVLQADAFERECEASGQYFELDERVRVELIGGVGVVAALLRSKLHSLRDQAESAARVHEAARAYRQGTS